MCAGPANSIQFLIGAFFIEGRSGSAVHQCVPNMLWHGIGAILTAVHVLHKWDVIISAERWLLLPAASRMEGGGDAVLGFVIVLLLGYDECTWRNDALFARRERASTGSRAGRAKRKKKEAGKRIPTGECQ